MQLFKAFCSCLFFETVSKGELVLDLSNSYIYKSCIRGNNVYTCALSAASYLHPVFSSALLNGRLLKSWICTLWFAFVQNDECEWMGTAPVSWVVSWCGGLCGETEGPYIHKGSASIGCWRSKISWWVSQNQRSANSWGFDQNPGPRSP